MTLKDHWNFILLNVISSNNVSMNLTGQNMVRFYFLFLNYKFISVSLTYYLSLISKALPKDVGFAICFVWK